jgi:cytochrome P450
MAEPEIHLTDPEVVRDPFTAYGRAREHSPIARIVAPGLGSLWAVTRHEDARAMLGDPRFELGADSYMRPDLPEACLVYMRTMQEMEGAEHARLRRLVSPAFSARRAAEFRPRIEPVVAALLDDLAAHAENGPVDLLAHLARPLPIDVICELVGIPEADRPRWRDYGAAIAAGSGQGFAESVPAIIEGAKEAVVRRRAEPGDDLLSDLIRAQAEDGDRLSETEMITLVWHLVLAGQTPTHLIANAVDVLLSNPSQIAALRDDLTLMPRAVEELMRWCGPQLLSIPRTARADVDLRGTLVRTGERVTVAIAAANRDPRAFTDADRLDVGRAEGTARHLGFAYGPHFCLGASLARVQTEVALTALLRRFPGLTLAAGAEETRRAADPGTWRLTSLPVTL